MTRHTAFPAIAVIAALAALLQPVAAAELQLTIHNAPTVPSRMFVALFDTAESMAANQPARSRIVDIKGNPTTVTFGDLAAGAYAFTVFADENANGKLDTNLVGMPTERYGFSNDATGFMGPPRFDAAAVRLGDAHKAISITLH